MDPQLGHGFIPRIGSQNYKAVDRCLGATLFDDPIELPWAIVEAQWAEKNLEFLGSLRDNGTKVILDDSGWRYRYAPTFEVRAMTTASWSPNEPVSPNDSDAMGRYVREALRCQAKMGGDAYLVPGFVPDDKHEDLRPAYAALASIVDSFDELPPRPLFMFVGAHAANLSTAHAMLDELPGFLSGIYLQVGPSAPVVDSPSKLLRLTELYLHAKSLDVAVIGGHAGAALAALRAAGVDAADAGLATSEAFNHTSKRRPRPEPDPDKERGGGPSSRTYIEALGRSFGSKRVQELRSVEAVRDLICGCRLPCHRFIGGDDYLARAQEHSLRARIAEARAMNVLPPSMRLSELTQKLTAQRSTITAVNAALAKAGIDLVDTRPTDNHLNWMARLAESRSAA